MGLKAMWKYTDSTNTQVTDGLVMIYTGSQEWIDFDIDTLAANGEVLAFDDEATTSTDTWKYLTDEPFAVTNGHEQVDFDTPRWYWLGIPVLASMEQIVAYDEGVSQAVWMYTTADEETATDGEQLVVLGSLMAHWLGLHVLHERGLILSWDCNIASGVWKYTTLSQASATDGNTIVYANSAPWYWSGMEVIKNRGEIHDWTYTETAGQGEVWQYVDGTNEQVKNRRDESDVVEVGSPQWFWRSISVIAQAGDVLAWNVTPQWQWTTASNYSVRRIDQPTQMITPYSSAWKRFEIDRLIAFDLVLAHDWDSVTEVSPDITLEQALTAKLSEINQWRDGQENKTPDTVEVNGVLWDCDPDSRERIVNVLTSSLSVPFWTDANNVDRTDFDLQAIHSSIVYKGFLIHERQRAMKTEVGSLTTVEDVQAYVVGWAS